MTFELNQDSTTSHALQHVAASASFGSLPDELLQHVLSFADVPTLGACVVASKNLNQLAKQDTVWAVHLKALLKTLYDDNCDVPFKLASESSSPKSTEFLQWLELSCRASGKSHYWDTTVNKGHYCSWLAILNLKKSEERDLFDWLFEDVSSFREYYKRAGSWAVVSYENSLMECGCCRCSCPMCPCYFTWDQEENFDDMPSIPLFRTERLDSIGSVTKLFTA